MAIGDRKFSNFEDGGEATVGDIVVGLRNGVNTRFDFPAVFGPGDIIPIENGGTAADNISDARTNLGLGTMAVQNANAVAITGGTIIADDIKVGGIQLDNLGNISGVEALSFEGATSGTITLIPEAIAGTNTITLPAATGTLALTSGIPSFPLSPANGGTGVNNGTSTITIAGNVEYSGAFTFNGTLTGNTAVTFPTTGTLATTSQLPTLPLSLSDGGTNKSLTASNGGIFYSDADSGEILAGTATARQMLQSGSSSAPAWSTATWPATTTANQILYSSAANTVGEITTAASSVLITSAGSVPSFSATLPSAVITNIPGRLLNVQIFTASGTWTKTSGTNTVIVEVVGGGGGSGGIPATAGGEYAQSGGGGGGGYSMKRIDVSAVSSASVTVGTGGSGGSAGTNAGSAGNTSSFGAYCSATGGAGGAAGAASSGNLTKIGGAGGAGSGGDINLNGEAGISSQVVSSSTLTSSIISHGGGTKWAPSNVINIATPGTATAGKSYGGGAAQPYTGPSASSAAGAAGANGIVIVYEYS